MNQRIHPLHARILAAALCAPPGIYASAAPSASVETNSNKVDRVAIQAVYDKINAAFVDNRMEGVMQYFADGYTQTDPHGHVLDIDGTSKKFQSLRNQILTADVECSITGITVGPDGDLVDMTTSTTGTGEKRILFIKLRGTYTNNLVVHDLWIHTPTGWLLKTRLMVVDDSHMKQG